VYSGKTAYICKGEVPLGEAGDPQQEEEVGPLGRKKNHRQHRIASGLSGHVQGWQTSSRTCQTRKEISMKRMRNLLFLAAVTLVALASIPVQVPTTGIFCDGRCTSDTKCVQCYGAGAVCLHGRCAL
jgi:hypothetical protein